MSCKECAYYWADEGEKHPTCKYVKLFYNDLAPCEQEDIAAYDDEPYEEETNDETD